MLTYQALSCVILRKFKATFLIVLCHVNVHLSPCFSSTLNTAYRSIWSTGNGILLDPTEPLKSWISSLSVRELEASLWESWLRVKNVLWACFKTLFGCRQHIQHSYQCVDSETIKGGDLKSLPQASLRCHARNPRRSWAKAEEVFGAERETAERERRQGWSSCVGRPAGCTFEICMKTMRLVCAAKSIQTISERGREFHRERERERESWRKGGRRLE